jgi:REP element-mobilizing transposase RayT
MSYSSTRIHFIWSTLHRAPIICADWKPRLHQYIAGILENKKSKVLAIGGIEDHIHIYCSLPTTITIADLAMLMKSNSTTFAREHFDAAFTWQEGYAAFSMSKSADDDVIAYIQNQVEHHRRRSFQEEYIAFLEKFEVSYDPRYVFA